MDEYVAKLIRVIRRNTSKKQFKKDFKIKEKTCYQKSGYDFYVEAGNPKKGGWHDIDNYL